MGNMTTEQFLNYKKIKDVKNLITDKQFLQINRLCDYYNTTTIKNRLTNIRQFILNNVEDRWLGRLRIITTKLKNDNISEYSCKVRYGDKWYDVQSEMKSKVRMDKNKFITLYGEVEGVKKWEERNKKTISYGLEPAIERYGEEEGRLRWEETLNKKINTMKERKKVKPYKNGRTLSEHQEKYGVCEGYKKWKKKNEKISYRFSKQYYIDTYGDLADQMWDEYCGGMSKTTKDSFIYRYGDDDGIRRYELFVDHMKHCQSKEYYIQKWGNDVGLTKYEEVISKKINNFTEKYSKISQKLFWSIYEKMDEKSNCYFYELNDEFTFYVWNEHFTIINVDFKIGNKIIEFDGDYWHSTEKQKEIDKLRDTYLIGKGYDVLRIKEGDFKKNSGKVIEKCLTFIKKKKNG